MDWMYQGDCHHFGVLKVVGVNQLFKEKGIFVFGNTLPNSCI